MAATLDLHVWGPAFGLPSIDAECLAAIAYLRHAVPGSAWRLVPSSDPSVSPQQHLPALHHDGDWVSGYRQIVARLASAGLGPGLDAGLDAAERADAAAFGAFVSAHAAPLVDLSLYVSAANWSAATRPAYSAILPFPLTWTVPPLMRAEAVRRVEHLGLAELDADLDPSRGLHLSAGRDALPESLRRHLPATAKRSVRAEMTPEQAAAIRLLALAEDCLSVLEAQLRRGPGDEGPLRFLSGARVSSLDCLAYGHLALMFKPWVPRAFLRDWALTGAPRLLEFVDAMTLTDLPWSAPRPPTLAGSAVRVVDSVIRNIPLLGEHYAEEMRLRAERGVRGLDRRILTLAAGLFLTTSLAVGCGLYVYKSLHPFGSALQTWRSRRGGSRLSQFGKIGAILGGTIGTMQAASTPPMRAAASKPHMRAAGNTPAGDVCLVEMDSEVD